MDEKQQTIKNAIGNLKSQIDLLEREILSYPWQKEEDCDMFYSIYTLMQGTICDIEQAFEEK